MAKDKITDYSATNASNTDIGGINIDEGMLPSAVNNALREQMTHQKEAFGSGTPLYVDQTNNRVGIGTTSPAGLLSLETNNPNVRFDDTDTSNNGEITLDNTALRIEADEDDAVASSLITFRVDGSERMRIKSDGDISIADGNLILASGHGIDFSATGSGDDSTGQTNQSELLTDYEHGLWTPTVNGDTTYHYQYGMYHKVGRKVTAWFRIRINAKNTPQADFFLDGLPYNNDHNGNVPGSGSIHFFSSIGTANTSLTTRVDGGGSTINVTGNVGSNSTSSAVNTGWVANGAEIQGFVMYMTDYA